MTKEKTSVDDDSDVDVRCGYGKCKLDCLQVFNNPKFMLFVLCFLVAAQGLCLSVYLLLHVSNIFLPRCLNHSLKNHLNHSDLAEVELDQLHEPHHEKTCFCHMPINKGADQPAHPHSLTSAFVVHY